MTVEREALFHFAALNGLSSGIFFNFSAESPFRTSFSGIFVDFSAESPFRTGFSGIFVDFSAEKIFRSDGDAEQVLGVEPFRPH